MNTNMNKPFELKVIVAFDGRWDNCSECAFHHVDTCGKYDCSGGVFKLIGVVEERKGKE